MKRTLVSAATLVAALHIARADLTLTQKVEGGGPVGDVVMSMKGTKTRIDAAGTSTIIDSQTGESMTLLHSEKRIVKMSANTAKAAADMVSKFAGVKQAPEKPKLVATGRHETINGIPTDVYTADTQFGNATYYVAPNYPDGAAILEQLRQITPAAFAGVNNFAPDYRDFPGIPVRTEMEIMGKHVVTTVASIKRDPIPDAMFAVPAGYEEIKMPNILGGKLPKVQPGTSPQP